jgi:hypothetical protein
VFIRKQALCKVGRHWLIDVNMRRKLSHKKIFAQLLWSDYSIAHFGGLKSRVDPAHHKAGVKHRYSVRIGTGMRRRRGQRGRIRGFGGGGGRCADALRGMQTHNRGRWHLSSRYPSIGLLIFGESSASLHLVCKPGRTYTQRVLDFFSWEDSSLHSFSW